MVGAPSLALEHYRAMDIKHVQNDTLSHFVLSRASTFSLAAMGDITYSSECIESSQVYNSNSQEVNIHAMIGTMVNYDLLISFPRHPISLFEPSLQRSIRRYFRFRFSFTCLMSLSCM
jgi:N-terminal acetyltransferase B complex non-catalytic subunit